MFEDKVLLWQYDGGRAKALRRIYAKYKDSLTTLATVLLYDKSAAEDVVRDVFTAFVRSCGTRDASRPNLPAGRFRPSGRLRSASRWAG